MKSKKRNRRVQLFRSLYFTFLLIFRIYLLFFCLIFLAQILFLNNLKSQEILKKSLIFNENENLKKKKFVEFPIDFLEIFN